MKKTILSIILLITAAYSFAQTPTSYWTMHSKSGFNYVDSTGTYNLNLTNYAQGYTQVASGGAVGKYLLLDTVSTSGYLIMKDPNIITGSFTIEMWIKPSKFFMGCQLFYFQNSGWNGGFRTPLTTGDCTPYISFTTTGGTEFKILLDGIGRKSLGYYVDGLWHQMVFQYNSSTGEKKVWVDGQSPVGFSTVQAGGTQGSGGMLWMNADQGSWYRKYTGGLDEVAYWNSFISGFLIKEHYNNVTSVPPKHYKYTTTINTLPPPVNLSATVVDTMAKAPTGMSFLTQLTTFPVPRFKSTSGMYCNVNWINPIYAGGRFQPGISDGTAVTNSTAIQTELAKNFNYMISLEWGGANQFNTAWINLANANPAYKVSIATFRTQITPLLSSQGLAADKYLQNAGGQFLNFEGNVTTTKIWRPTNNPTIYNADAVATRALIQSTKSLLTRPINFISENGEVLGDLYHDATVTNDPVVLSDFNSSGIATKALYLSKKRFELERAYRDTILTILPGVDTCQYAMYRMSGYYDYDWKWNYIRGVQTQKNGQYYSTGDMYFRGPAFWRGRSSSSATVCGGNKNRAWRGINWHLTARKIELDSTDKLFSPFVAAGWDADVNLHMPPAQYLGILKNMVALGAEYFYPGYFNEASAYNGTTCIPNSPNGYIWQYVVPPYAQAIASYCEDILRSGNVMAGDVNQEHDYSGPRTGNGYNFFCNDPRKIVIVRKSGTRYLISSSLNQVVINKGNVEDESNTTCTIDGVNYTFKTRRQGSNYILDITSGNIFYQIDGFHENSHPARWSQDWSIEAELADTTNGTRATTFTSTFPNMTNFKTVVNLTSTKFAQYKILPRIAGPKYLFIKGSGTGQVSVSVNGGASVSGPITTLGWYKVNLGTIGISTASTVRITSGATHSLDSICITSNEDKYTATDISCEFDVNITGNLNVCGTGTTTLTADAATSYLWSTSATTQAITADSGAYSVTATDAAGCTSIANATVVSNPAPSETLTINPFPCCTGINSTITAVGGASNYLWSTGATSQNLSVSISGTYTCTITNPGGCTATADTAVTFSTCGTSCNPPDTFYTWKIKQKSFTVRWTLDASAVGGYKIFYKDMTTNVTKNVTKGPAAANAGQRFIGCQVGSTTGCLVPNRTYSVWIKTICDQGVLSTAATDTLSITTLP